jgi:FKBP-type peptidyl-prolyl cis-trans isomerase
MSIKLSFALMAAVCLAGCDKPAATSSDNKTPPPPPTASSTPAPAAAPASPAPAASSAASAEWKTTASGLKYQVLKQGNGPASPKATDTVKVHYHGTLLNGTVFDSSVERGQPISFPLNRVIKGWTEGLQLMKVGDKFKFEIPPDLAYGPNSPSPKIPPNSTLVFEVELLGIE